MTERPQNIPGSAAHFERGDTSHAVRLCRKAIARAESLGSPRARASAYWNASAMQARRGDVAAAVPLAYLTLAARKRAMARIGQTRSGLIEDALVVAAGIAVVAMAVRHHENS